MARTQEDGRRPIEFRPAWTRAAYRHFVYRLEVTKGRLPAYAVPSALPLFTLTDTVIWLRVRRFCKRLCREIADAGGEASFERYEAQQCPYCKRWLVGAEAEVLRKNIDWQRMTPADEVPRCSTCATTADQSA